MNDAMQNLLTRRSVSVKDMVAPAPDAVDLELILRAATRVPDHGKLTPWRIVVLREDGQRKLGNIAAQAYAEQNSEIEEKHLEHERARFSRAPLCLAVLSIPKEGLKPIWEQQLSAGCVCMNILHAAHALGYAAKWLTEWVAYNEQILAALGGREGDAIAGFIYLGSKTGETEDRARPELKDVVSEYR